jgi:nucleolysin TIA-1/TIAR
MCFTDGGQDNSNEDAPENNPSYTTVYVGNLPHDVSYYVGLVWFV